MMELICICAGLYGTIGLPLGIRWLCRLFSGQKGADIIGVIAWMSFFGSWIDTYHLVMGGVGGILLWSLCCLAVNYLFYTWYFTRGKKQQTEEILT